MDKQPSHHHQMLAKQCVKNAKAVMGDGWRHVSLDIRWGLVCANIVALHYSQDEGNSSDRVRAMINEVTELCRTAVYGTKESAPEEFS